MQKRSIGSKRDIAWGEKDCPKLSGFLSQIGCLIVTRSHRKPLFEVALKMRLVGKPQIDRHLA